MTPARLATILAYCDMPERELARRLGYSPGAVRMWSTGRASVPERVADWLERLLAHRKAHPDPKPPKRSVAA